MQATGSYPARRRRYLATLIVGVALLAGATRHTVQAQAVEDDTAMVVPRPGARGSASLPQPLSPSEAAVVKRIFELQRLGKQHEADTEIARLTDKSLLGHILAERYLGRNYRSTPEDLNSWLDSYASLPQAPALYALLRQRTARGAILPQQPSTTMLESNTQLAQPEERDPTEDSFRRNPMLDRAVREHIRDANFTPATVLRLIDQTNIPAAYSAALKGDVAQALFIANRDEDALRVGTAAVQEAPHDAGFAAYMAGLAAWRLDQLDTARRFFEAAARSQSAAASTRSAAAFWAARSNLRTRNPAGYVPWLTRAAREPRTFYGILARKALGLPSAYAWERELLGDADAAVLAETEQGNRALALIQVGRPDLAELEVRRLWPLVEDRPALRRAMLIAANTAGLTNLSAQLATLVQTADGRPRDFARFPVPRLRPQDGYRIDPALLYGLVRIESNFNAAAVSPVGARGLMQVMPVTAGYVTGDPSLAGANQQRLHDPAFNLEVGQRYVAYLGQHQDINDDLIRLLASYNAGPGNLSRWSNNIVDKGDPLLFIEAIPVGETRAFVQRVLTYSWIYASRLRLPSPSLDELAAGVFPRLHHPTIRDLNIPG